MIRVLSKYILLLLIGCTVVCCKKAQQPLVHSDEEIAAVMLDLYIANVALKEVDTLYKDSLRVIYRNQIEQIHQIDLADIEDDIASIQTNPKYYKRIHTMVEDSIAMIDKKMNSSKTKEKVFKK